MKRLVFVFSLALMIGLFALPGSVMLSHGAGNSTDQGQATVPESNKEQVTAPKAQGQATVPESNKEQVTAPKAQGQATAKTHRKAASHHRHYRNHRDHDRSYPRYYRGYYDPYYSDYYYPRSYNYGPGVSLDTPFFGITIP
jgi:hypothetical protein